MANNLNSNVTNKVARIFLEEFESQRVASRTVNTTLLTPEFTPQFGDTIRIKRPHQYKSISTPDGDITIDVPTTTAPYVKNNIISGSALATVQNYITVPIEWTNRQEALDLDQLREIIRPAAQECVTTFETNFIRFMINNCGLSYGTTGNPLTKWGDVASFQALLSSIGCPMSGNTYALMNPFMTRNLADTQTGLASGSNNLVTSAWEKAQISRNFGGLQALTSNSLTSFQSGALPTSDRSGTLASEPNATYVVAKDSMQQTLLLTGLGSTLISPGINAGDVIEFTGPGSDARSRINVKTRQVAFDEAGNAIPWRCTVLEDANVTAAGAATVIVSAAAIHETVNLQPGQYNNISAALAAADAFTILGAVDTFYQPNIFYHEEAFGIGTIRLPKLHTWDTVAETADGISIRVTKYSDGDTNTQQIRFDLLPIHSCFNPLFAGQGWGE